MLTQFIIIFFAFIVTALLARELSVEDFGYYSLIKSIFAIFFVVCSVCNDPYLINAISDNKNNLVPTVFLNKIYTLRIVFYLLVFLVFYLSMPTDTALQKTILISMAATYFFQIINFGILHLKSSAKGEYAFKIVLLSSLLPLIVSLMLYYFDNSLLSIFIFQPLLFLFFYLLLCKESKYEFICLKLKDIILIFKNVWPIFITSIFVILSTKLDVLVIGTMLSYREVATYSVAVQITEPFSFVVTAFSASIIYKLKRSDNANSIIAGMRAVIFYALLVVIFIFIFGELLIEYIYGSLYIESISIAKILAISKVFVFLNIYINVLFVVEKRLKLRMKRILFSSIVTLILTCIFIPIFGMVGAAISITFVQFMMATFVNLLDSKSAPYFKLLMRAVNPLCKTKFGV